jgi:hypothetical protein
MAGTYAGYAPAPGPHVATTASYLAMLPSMEVASALFDALYTQVSLHQNRLGHYPPFHFRDGRVGPLLHEFQANLAAAEATIAVRNASRRVPYTLLIPSKIPASIQVLRARWKLPSVADVGTDAIVTRSTQPARSPADGRWPPTLAEVSL